MTTKEILQALRFAKRLADLRNTARGGRKLEIKAENRKQEKEEKGYHLSN